MKILQIIPHYFPSTHFGGTPVSCHYLSSSLVKLGHQVDVLTTDAFSRTQRYVVKAQPEKYANYQVFRFKNLSNRLAYNNRFATPIPSFTFLRQLTTYDVIQLHEYRNLLNVLICLFKPFTRATYILYPLGTFPIHNTQIGFKKIFDIFFAKIINWATDVYVVVSNVEKASLVKNGVSRRKIVTIYYGIDVVEAKFAKNKVFNQPYILYLGRIDKRKGVDLLIRAYQKSSIFKNNIHLLIVGNDNNFLDKCEALVRKYKLKRFVHFREPITGIKKATLYRDARLVVYVTENEAYGLVPMEAALCGTASIVANTAGVAEVLGKYGIGKSVKYGDIEELVMFLKKMAVHENRVPKGKINKLLKEYNWQVVTKRFIKVYQNV
jgi:glycosyltransferase involved in cell wall biosynthesis